jgi:hypothetical protein
MPDPNLLRVVLILFVVGAISLRVLAARRPKARTGARLGSLALVVILAVVLGLLAWSVVGTYVGRLPHD